MKRSIDDFLDGLVEDEELMGCSTRLYPSFAAKLDDLARMLGVSRSLLMRRFIEVGYEDLRGPLEAAAAARAEQRRAKAAENMARMRAKKEGEPS